MSALADHALTVAWVGRSPPHGQPCAQVGSIAQALALAPSPELLVIDPVDPTEWKDWLAFAQPALHRTGLVLVVPEVDAAMQAKASAAGVLCCLPRGLDLAARAAVLAAALQLQRLRRAELDPARLARTGGATLRTASWTLRTPEQAEAVATLMAACCPAPERRVGGILELLINAIEHGNLEITGPDKRALLSEGRWYDELLLRLADPRWAARRVWVTFEREPSGTIVFCIEDEGEGFDFAEVLARELSKNDTRHGRGIALARLMSFDELKWEGRGNRVVGRIFP